MATRERIVCDCGGELRRPLPRNCPHCGGRIVAVRRRWWTWAAPALVAVMIFAALASFVWWAAAAR
ncbi:MAG: hypothetical protein RIC55_35465 [Pirellulaceae bacterium]